MLYQHRLISVNVKALIKGFLNAASTFALVIEYGSKFISVAELFKPHCITRYEPLSISLQRKEDGFVSQSCLSEIDVPVLILFKVREGRSSGAGAKTI